MYNNNTGVTINNAPQGRYIVKKMEIMEGYVR